MLLNFLIRSQSIAETGSGAVVGACWEGACREGACREEACREGACREGACREGACREGACREGACREGACREGACRKGGGIGSRVGIGGRVGIGAISGKDVFRPSEVPLLLYGASSVVYSGGVGEWALPRQLRIRCSRCNALIVFRC